MTTNTSAPTGNVSTVGNLPSPNARPDIIHAFQSPSFPCNPIPFAIGLADYVREHGTGSIKSDEAKAILWILIGQAYGTLATVDLGEEWKRLDAALPLA